jgi:hypothetical protein
MLIGILQKNLTRVNLKHFSEEPLQQDVQTVLQENLEGEELRRK